MSPEINVLLREKNTLVFTRRWGVKAIICLVIIIIFIAILTPRK